jgi:hypothetical protein
MEPTGIDVGRLELSNSGNVRKRKTFVGDEEQIPIRPYNAVQGAR